MAEQDEVYLVCGLVGPGDQMVRGSVTRKCGVCSRQIWTAPTGQKFLAERPDVVAVCEPCGMARMKEEDEIEINVVPGAHEELAEFFKNDGQTLH